MMRVLDLFSGIGGFSLGLERAGMMDLRRAARISESREDGELNPRWVEWLMGFPESWTEVPLSATQSSRKSRK